MLKVDLLNRSLSGRAGSDHPLSRLKPSTENLHEDYERDFDKQEDSARTKEDGMNNSDTNMHSSNSKFTI